MAPSFHRNALSSCSRRFVWPPTEGGGGSSPEVHLHKDRATGCGCPPGETPSHACTPHGNPQMRGLRGVR